MSKTLSLKTLKVKLAQHRVVEVPEFGEGMTVNAHGLTVAGRQTLGLILQQMGVSKPENGAVAAPPSPAALAEFKVVNAALGAYDDDGNLVFGTTAMEAINFVRHLPGEYSEAVSRIADAVIELTKGSAGGSDQAAVEDAEKN